MASFNSDVVGANAPAGTGHGVFKMSTHLHATAAVSAAMTTNDVINFGYLPPGAVVVGATLKAATQLDSGTALTLDLGITGSAQLFKAAVSTVGRAAGASADGALAAAGALYKNTTGKRVLVIGTCHAAAGTAVAGTLECDIEFYVEDAAGSQA